MGSEGPVSPAPFPNTPEIIKANNASPMIRIRKKDFCLILPNIAIVWVFKFLLVAKIQFPSQ